MVCDEENEREDQLPKAAHQLKGFFPSVWPLDDENQSGKGCIVSCLIVAAVNMFMVIGRKEQKCTS